VIKRKLIFIVPLLLAGLHLPSQNPYIQHYTTYDGLPSNIVYNVFQDSRKFIWFATDAGAVRFDGSTFATYTKNDGLNTSKIIRIKEDSFGRVWITNWDGSLNYFFQNKIFNSTNAPFLDSLKPSEPFHEFFQDEDKTIYFYNVMYEVSALDTNNHVRKFDNLYEYFEENLRRKDGSKVEGNFDSTIWNSKSEVYIANLYMIRKIPIGEYMLWTRFGLLKIKELFKDPVLVGATGWGFLRTSFNRDSLFYIIGYGKYIYKYKDDHVVELTELPFYIYYTMSRQNALLLDKGGYYWIGTFDDGLYCLQEESISQQQSIKPNTLQSWVKKRGKILQHLDIRQVNGIFQDHEGNIWVSSAIEGIYKFSPYLNSHQHYQTDLFMDKGIWEMAPEPWGGMWLSNGKTIYLLKNDQLFTLNLEEPNTSFDVIYHLKTNNLIIGQKYSYFYALKDVIPDPVTNKVNFSQVDTSLLYMSDITFNEREDKISCFNYFDVNLIHPDTIFKPYKGYNPIYLKDYNVGSRIHYIYYNKNDDLIVNANQNYILTSDTFLYVKELSFLDRKRIIQHLNLNDSTELFNIENESVYLFFNENFFDLTSVKNNASGLQIQQVAWDTPVLYLANSRNIYKCDHPLQILAGDSVGIQLIDINFRNIHKILVQNDSLYIASDDGLTVIPEAMIDTIIFNHPIPYLQSILVNDKEADLSAQNLSLRGRQNLKFVFSSINYSSTPVIYSYKLEGADPDWASSVGQIVSYQNLRPGTYVFKLKISKLNLPWSQPLEYSIVVKPTFWQHPVSVGFIIVIILTFLSLIFLRVMTSRIKRREMDHQLIVLEQKALQSMMNPHFIFNALGSIQNFLLQNKPGEAGVYLSQFARLIRQNLGSINAAQVSLEEEVDRIKNYLDLEKLRMSNRFDYIIQMDDSIDADEDLLIPSMIIQPFVENAIWHGISPLDNNGWIRLSFSLPSRERMEIIIEDNGIGITQSAQFSTSSQSHLHMGMTMTRKRLEIIGRKHGVETSVTTSEAFPDSPNPGTRVVLVVPVAYSEVDG
jgi:two-component sensor histidine kinase